MDSTGTETNRDRVRRILLNPLGFRFPKATDPERQRQLLDGLTDELGYLTDASLAVLRDMLASKGQGSARNFWPDRATFIGCAEAVQPRPLEELPALLSWLASVEGPRAIEAGTLVETIEYVERRKVPPYSDQARALVAERAADNRRRLVVISERRAAGYGLAPDDIAWERWYRERQEAGEALVARELARRGKKAAVAS